MRKLDIVGKIIPFNRQDCTKHLASSDGLAFIGVNDHNLQPSEPLAYDPSTANTKEVLHVSTVQLEIYQNAH